MPLSQSNDTDLNYEIIPTYNVKAKSPPKKKISQYVRKKDRQTTTSCNKMTPKKHMPHPGISLSYRHTSPLKGLINLISDVGLTANLCCKVPWQCAPPCAWSLPARLPNFTTSGNQTSSHDKPQPHRLALPCHCKLMKGESNNEDHHLETRGRCQELRFLCVFPMSFHIFSSFI